MLTKEELRIVFMGTPEFAVGSLQRLVEGGYNVVGVVTQPDKPVGRHGSVLRASAVKEYALAHGLPVLQPEKMRDEVFLASLRSLRANLQVVVAFRMLPEVVWSMPDYGTFNVHAALLPQYRGAAPINWAIINGETETGVSTFFLDHDIDTGKVILRKPTPIGPDDNVETVYDRLMALGADACIETVERIMESDGHPAAIPQEQLATGEPLKPAPKIFKETCEIDWSKSAAEVRNFIRGLSPVPGAWTTVNDEKGRELSLKIYSSTVVDGPDDKQGQRGRHLTIKCGQGWLRIDELQLAGKKRMSAADFLNGNVSLHFKL